MKRDENLKEMTNEDLIRFINSKNQDEEFIINIQFSREDHKNESK